jgi:hypothetical protein
MAIRKAGSRRIVVDETAYCWRIRRRATNGQTDYGGGTLHIAIGLAEQRGSVLVLLTDRPHPKDCVERQIVPITPADVAWWIREALRSGWIPERPGPQLVLRMRGQSLEPVA